MKLSWMRSLVSARGAAWLVALGLLAYAIVAAEPPPQDDDATGAGPDVQGVQPH